MKLRFNKNRLILRMKDVINILKISLTSLLAYFVLMKPFYLLFPEISNFSLYLKIPILVSFSYYFKNLFDIKFNGRDYF